MANLNVNRNVSDAFYRYKMPRLIAKVKKILCDSCHHIADLCWWIFTFCILYFMLWLQIIFYMWIPINRLHLHSVIDFKGLTFSINSCAFVFFAKREWILDSNIICTTSLFVDAGTMGHIPYFLDYESRFSCHGGRSTSLSACLLPLGYRLIAVSQRVAMMDQSHALCRQQTKSLWVGEGFDLCCSTGCIVTGPVLWAAVMLLPI